LSQLAVALLYLALPLAHGAGGHALAGSLASLKLGPLELSEPAALLSAMLAGHVLTWAAVLGAAPVMLLALLLGPVFCSWVCPWGLLSEGVDALRQRGRRRSWPAGGGVERRTRLLVLLGFFLLSLFFAVPLAALLSAPRLLSALPLEALYLRALSPVTGGLLLALLLLESCGPRRLWCRALCPVGALASFLHRPFGAGVRCEEGRCRCPSTPPCQLACPWGLDPRRPGPLDGCTNCLRCVEVCPSEALELAWGGPGRRPGG
jgi:ferredoxin-type protein NapH